MIKFSCDRIVIEVRDEVLKIFEQYRQERMTCLKLEEFFMEKDLRMGT